MKIYKCLLTMSCRGGSSTAESEQCFDGHTGALCGACKDGYDYDFVRNKCSRCATADKMMLRLSLIMFIGLLVAVLIGVLYYKSRHKWQWSAALILFKDQARAGISMGTQLHTVNEIESAMASDSMRSADDVEAKKRAQQSQNLRKSLLMKVKIVVAAWQISSSATTVLFQVPFPPLYSKVTQIFGVIGLAMFNVGSMKCLIGWSFFDKLVAVTLAPFGLVVLLAVPYWLYERHKKRKIRDIVSDITYATLLFIYIILPSISTTVITYFSCIHFDRGNMKDLRVIATDLSVKCTSTRYRRWSFYVAIMIVIWPIGVTLSLALLLWCNRAKINPPLGASKSSAPAIVPTSTYSPVIDDETYTPASSVSEDDHNKENDAASSGAINQPRRRRRSSVVVIDRFRREQRRYRSAMHQLAKLDRREGDPSLAGLHFIFEEFEPR